MYKIGDRAFVYEVGRHSLIGVTKGSDFKTSSAFDNSQGLESCASHKFIDLVKMATKELAESEQSVELA